MKKILLTQEKVALVDDTDFEAVNAYKWHTVKNGRTFYAARKTRTPGQTGQKRVFLHQFLMGCDAPRIDHRDGNGLNNQRENLRPATHRQNNQAFKLKRLNASSSYRGVSWSSREEQWEARGRAYDGKKLFLGYFSDEKEAARAYDTHARKTYGDFASPNFSL